MSGVFYDATSVALEILMRAVEKTVKNQELTKEETILVGRAIGWLTLMTAGTDSDILKMLADASDEVASVKSVPKVEIPTGKPIKVSGGKRRKMHGGVGIVPLIVAGIALLYGGTTTNNIMTLKARRDIIRTEALKQIHSSCPLDLTIGPPAAPLIDWTGEHAAALSQYKADVATCEATKSAVAARVEQAEESLNQAWRRIPSNVAAFSTIATIAVTGPASGVVAAAGTGVTIGAAMKQLTETVISGQIPTDSKELNKYVDAISNVFPTPTPAPEQGGRKKTRRSSLKKRKTQRRRKY